MIFRSFEVYKTHWHAKNVHFNHTITTHSTTHNELSRKPLSRNTINIRMATAQILNCIVCHELVWPRQQAVQCDGCFRWNHRMCNTGKLYLLIYTLIL